MFENSKLIIANHVTATQSRLDRAELEAREEFELALRSALIENEEGARLAIAKEIAAELTVTRSGRPAVGVSEMVKEVIRSAFRSGLFGSGATIGTIRFHRDVSGIDVWGSAATASYRAYEAYQEATDYRERNGAR